MASICCLSWASPSLPFWIRSDACGGWGCGALCGGAWLQLQLAGELSGLGIAAKEACNPSGVGSLHLGLSVARKTCCLRGGQLHVGGCVAF